jgi:hypothetical protein
VPKTYRARCSRCPWVGEHWKHEETARLDADTHARETGHSPVRHAEEPSVPPETVTKLRRIGRDRAKKVDALEQVTDELRAEVRAARDLGMTEMALSEAAGVARETIRKWLGKVPGAKRTPR